jgi:hypothetical protein
MSVEHYQQRADYHAKRAGIDPEFFRRLIHTESGWNPSATTKESTATGLGQVLVRTASNPGYGVKPLQNRHDPEESLRFSADYLAALNSTNLVGGDKDKLAVAYQWGIGNLQNHGMSNLPPVTAQYVDTVSRGIPKDPSGKRHSAQPTAVAAAPVQSPPVQPRPLQPQPVSEPGMARLAAERAASERAEALASVIGSSTAPQESKGMAIASYEAPVATPLETAPIAAARIGKQFNMPGSNKHRNIQQGLA